MSQKLKYALLGFLVAALGLWGLAVTIPNSFSSGEVVSAAKMNQNFQALKAAVDQLEAKLSEVQAGQKALPSSGGLLGYAYVEADGTVTGSFNSAGGTVWTVPQVFGSPGQYYVEFGDVGQINGAVVVVSQDLSAHCMGSPTASAGEVFVECRSVSTGNLAAVGFQILLVE